MRALLLVLVSTVAFADPRPREATVRITLEYTGPIEKRAAKPGIEVAAVLPITSIAQPRIEQEQILIALIADTSDKDVEEKADYYYRLAELYAAMNRNHRQKGEVQKTQDTLAKMVRTYDLLVDNFAFRNYPRLDVALLDYGNTLQANGKMKEARIQYDKLIKNYPASKNVSEAYLALADYYFEQNQLADAETFYKQVLKFPSSPVYRYAVYKRGWIQLNLQRPQEALESFFQVAKSDKDSLARVARSDFVRVFAQIGKPKDAAAAFAKLGGDTRALINELASIYIQQGKPELATAIYQDQLRTAAPGQVCEVMSSLAQAAASTKQEVEICLSELAPMRQWARANGATLTCRARCKD